MAQLKKNWLQYLSPQDIDDIHNASMQVLTEVGVRIEDEEITAKLQDCGCRLEKGRVLFAADLIEKALATVRHEETMIGRGGHKIHIQEGHVFTHTGASIPAIYDRESGRRRNAILNDLRDLIRLMNSLDFLDMPGALICPQEVPPAMSEIRQQEMLLRYSKKPISGVGVASAKQTPYVIEMYQALAETVPEADKYPMMKVGLSPESPLYYPPEIVSIMKDFIGAGLPTVPLVAPIVGFTAPMTLAGGLTQMNASMLAYTVLSHLINPRTLVVYGARLAFAHMATGCSIWGLPEVGLAGACSVQLARHYGILSDVYGLSTTSCVFDSQAGYEKAVNGLMPLLAGANIISGFGSFTSGLMSAFEQLVIDNELFAMLYRAAQGVAVSPDRLAVEAIANAMAGESFVAQDHTLKYLRTGEVFQPRLGFDGLWSQWEAEGSKDIRQRAKEEVRTRLQSEEDLPLPPEVDREFKRIIAAAEANLL